MGHVQKIWCDNSYRSFRWAVGQSVFLSLQTQVTLRARQICFVKLVRVHCLSIASSGAFRAELVRMQDTAAADPSGDWNYPARVTYSRLPHPYRTLETDDNAPWSLLEKVQPSVAVSKISPQSLRSADKAPQHQPLSAKNFFHHVKKFVLQQSKRKRSDSDTGN